MNIKTKAILLAALMLGGSSGVYAQLTGGVQEERNVGDFTYQKNKKRQSPGAARSKALYGSATQRPDHLNNALLKYFPPIFSQDQGSCDAAAYIGYQWTYERNNYYGLDGSLDENRFTSHFNYLLAHNYQGTSKSGMLQNVGNPSAADYGGQTYSKYFGNQTCSDTDYGWMQGYDKWYNTIHNRDWTATNIEQSVMTEGGREILKQWLWNHNGDYDFNAGGVAWFGMASIGMKTGPIPNTPTNKQLGLVGKRYVADWGPSYDHAQTIVGYDDRIEFDLDSNGIYGEKDKDEVGAWIIANSWGSGWENNGFVYCPYARSVTSSKRSSPWSVTRHFIRKDYEPLRTIKVKLAFSKRSLLWLSVTATQDTASDVSTDSLAMDHFKNAGDGTRNFNDPPSTPMLGKWIDGYHYEPMEFGYDITELTQNFDRRKPIKYFFNIYTYPRTPEEKSGTGRLYSASIIDYELDKEGIEFPFKVENVQITGSGKLYRVSVIVPGEQINAPTNLTLTEGTLVWQKPVTTSLPIKKYYIYNDNMVIDSVDAGTLSYSPTLVNDKAYGIAAVYDYRNKTVVSDPSNLVTFPVEEQSTDNYVLDMRQTMAAVENVDFKASKGGTMEYWIKPRDVTSYSNQICNPIYFFSSMNSGKCIVAGWGSNGSYSTQNNAVKLNEWNHVAVVIDNFVLKIFVNDKLIRRTSYSTYSKIKAFDNFYIGRQENNGLIDAEIDEIRLWNRPLTDNEIFNNYRVGIASPSQQDSLVLYYKGDIIEEDGVKKIRDYARGHHAVITDPDNVSVLVDNSFLTGPKNFTPAITTAATDIYAGMQTRFTIDAPMSVKQYKWSIDGQELSVGNTKSPYITFSEDGDHVLSVTTTDISGNTAVTNLNVSVKTLPMPIADFDVAEDNLPASKYFSFVNRSTGVNCTYTWSMPGADIEKVYATNASARFLEVGTYPVTLTVTNAAGSASVTRNVTAVASAPYVDFKVEPSAILLGDKVFFHDKSILGPEKWQWEVNHVSGKRNYVIHGQNTAFTPEAPGYYNVTLKSSNAHGESSNTMKKAFAVSNADPGNGLSMSGSGERFAVPTPFTSNTRNFTIDTWLYPSTYKGALTMATDDGKLKTWANEDGSVGVYVNGKQVVSAPGFITKDEWHHYAITFATGNVKFYRDTELFSAPSLRLGLSCPAWTGSLTVSSDTASFKGIFDEFRIWGKTLNESQLKQISNQPISADDISTAKSANGLKVYYQFNQNTGDLIDATGNELTGRRLGFGPDGDAWTTALGVFTLDFGGDEASDVSADYLTNYKAPFLHTDNSVSTTNSNNLLELKTGTADSKWVIGNAVVTDKATTGAHVAKNQNYDINFRTGYYGFADTLRNHLFYQTTTLPAGYYTLTVSPSADGSFKTDSSFVCVTRGEEFVDMSTYEKKSAAYAPLSKQTITFTVGEDEPITLGLIINLEGWSAIDIAEFKLMRTPVKVVEQDDQTSVYDAVDGGDMKRYTPMSHAIRVINREPRRMRVFTIDGQLVFDHLVEGVHIIPFAPGIYVVDGEKIKVD